MYYALWDTQVNRRMATGCNCTTKEGVKKQLWDYFQPDREEIFLTNNIEDVSLDLLLEVGEFILEEQEQPFPDDEF
jgi:hypothetical protein